MRIGLLAGIFVAFGILAPAVAQRRSLPPSDQAAARESRLPAEKYGAWEVENLSSGLFSASTSNNANGLFGAFCSRRGCATFFSASSTCEEKANYPALVNAPDGAFTVNLRCEKIGKRNWLILEDDEAVLNAITIGGVIGFATPMASGEFSVSRFSLVGAARAYARARSLGAASPPRPGGSDERRL